MSPDGVQEPSRESGAGAPAASLTLVRVQRRRAALQPSRKAGDLTQQLLDGKALSPMAPPMPAADAPVASAPAAPAPIAPAPLPRPILLAAPAAEDPAGVITPPPADETDAPAPSDPEPEAVADAAPMIGLTEPQAATLAPADEAQTVAPVAFSSAPEERSLPPVEPAVEMPALKEETVAPAREVAPTSADALIDYWDERAGDRLFPALAELDRERIAQSWPNAVLLTFASGDMPRLTRLGEPDGEIEFNLMMTDWILSRGRQAAERAEALEEEQRFPMGRGRMRYRLVLLPCSDDGARVDHMLCHVSRITEPKLSAVASFKRWLAS